MVGASVLCHLTKFGWTDGCLLERSVLAARFSWHAASGIRALNADSNMATLLAYGIREFGFYAMDSLRLENSFGTWSAEFTQAYTPGMTGLDRWIDWMRGDFIGHEAAHNEH